MIIAFTPTYISPYVQERPIFTMAVRVVGYNIFIARIVFRGIRYIVMDQMVRCRAAAKQKASMLLEKPLTGERIGSKQNVVL